ncbi:hypothetical protein Tco_0352966 [Tanacetum coccineum]
MLVEVGKFTFPVDFRLFLKNGKEEDSKFPSFWVGPFFTLLNAVIRFKPGYKLNLGVGTERMIFHIDSAIKYSYSNDDTCFSIGLSSMKSLEEIFDALLVEGSKILIPSKENPFEDEIFAAFDEFIAHISAAM